MSGQQDGIPYIGSKISLISKNDIRYEGLLFNIDTKQSMVALQTVQSFGTEHRRGGVFLSDGQTPNPEFVPASSQISQYATFKASEIKDLHVCEAAAPETQPPPPPPQQQQQETCSPPLPPSPPQPPMAANQDKRSEQLLSPSALSSSSKGTKDSKEATSGRSALENRNAAKSVNESSKSENVAAPQNPSNSMSKDGKASQNSNNGNRSNNRTIPGMGGHLLRRRERGVDGDKVPELADGEFNFTEGLGVFNKEEEFTKLEQQTSEISISTTTTTAAYEKSSFFDTISCDALDRLDGRNGRMRASEERKLNTETFGAAGLNNNNRRFYGNRGGRGGYRGGRGGRNGYRGGRGGRGRGRSNNNYGGRGDGSYRGGRGGGHQGGYNNYNRGGDTQSNGASHEAFNN